MCSEEIFKRDQEWLRQILEQVVRTNGVQQTRVVSIAVMAVAKRMGFTHGGGGVFTKLDANGSEASDG